ncbi:hypothetical protein FRX31_005931, partial [Thalictrum thalictroides]
MVSTPLGLGFGRDQAMFPNISTKITPLAQTSINSEGSATYAEKAKQNNQPIVDFSNLPTPGFRGEYPTIKLPKKAYERGVEYC